MVYFCLSISMGKRKFIDVENFILCHFNIHLIQYTLILLGRVALLVDRIVLEAIRNPELLLFTG